ncbi:MAG: hypothetical protein AAB495_03900 [Patescibacteria group bacterium]
MTPEEILQKHIEGKPSIEDSKLLAAASLITATRTKDLADASVLLAKTTQISAEELSKSNDASIRWMKWLTVVLIVVGVMQTAIAVIALFISLRLQ